jgi:hypothetical protein
MLCVPAKIFKGASRYDLCPDISSCVQISFSFRVSQVKSAQNSEEELLYMIQYLLTPLTVCRNRKCTLSPSSWSVAWCWYSFSHTPVPFVLQTHRTSGVLFRFCHLIYYDSRCTATKQRQDLNKIGERCARIVNGPPGILSRVTMPPQQG